MFVMVASQEDVGGYQRCRGLKLNDTRIVAWILLFVLSHIIKGHKSLLVLSKYAEDLEKVSNSTTFSI